MLRTRTRSPEAEAELQKLVDTFGQVEAVVIGENRYTVADLIDAGLAAKFGKDATPNMSARALRMVAGRIAGLYGNRAKTSEAAVQAIEDRLKVANASVVRLQGELALARRARVLEPQDVDYIRTQVAFGVKPEAIARLMGIDTATVTEWTSKRRAFSWKNWRRRRDTPQRALDL